MEEVEVEAEEELKAILREAFGDSSSDSDGEPSHDRPGRVKANDSSHEIVRPDTIFGDSHIWEPITEINGLWICRDLLSGDQQSSLLSALEKDGYLSEASHNQAMRFGDLPPWALELSYLIRESVVMSGYSSESTDLINSDECNETCLFPSELLWREPLFNQLIVNIYQPGEGICAHVDLMRFEDGIAIISLESSCVMHFTSVEAEVNHKIPVLLTPGSVVLMWGEARFLWKHEINRKPGFQKWQGQELDQKRRTSVTLRRLRQTE
ncbi:tRNA (carboxymethyluridine(34)-5-O)-methyltransferase [Handroanthus impetiginosus]|uniref:tRNA (Carboxymethyluridine(34)-5-O)-methyltransferase n=1 Tax=Handroanthus impetiginosus TaxID=429701 RepID=A0A2G9GMZ9_9LAMI|nr:tRNA (carboxymethyluridine(34)-5-O)-methyltransferase [Handroanthus impetiginosus]